MRDKFIDEKIATEVMGWHKLSFSDAWISGATFRECLIEDWNPSESIGKSWLVVEKMIKEYWFDLNSNAGNLWDASFKEKTITAKTYFVCNENTAPLAICKAALKAVGEKK